MLDAATTTLTTFLKAPSKALQFQEEIVASSLDVNPKLGGTRAAQSLPLF